MNTPSLILAFVFSFSLVHGQSDPLNNNYDRMKNDVRAIRSNLIAKPLTADSISTVFQKALINGIIPHWLTTPWSFEGHTSMPREGTIACGYFVSTTLKDMGFNLNRYKLAQQTPFNEAKTLSLGQAVHTIESLSAEERIRQLNTFLSEGIHFIGFDRSHVGYIVKENDSLYLIHSNYINAEGVIRESVEESMVFASYNKIHIVPISSNAALLKKWLNNEPIEVYTE